MSRFKFVIIISALVLNAHAQNDLDAIRYSRLGVGGTSRFISMGGAFGAVGADLSAASFNPAGLALFRKGDIAFSAGVRSTNNSGSIYKTTANAFDLKAVYNNFGLAAAWTPKADPDSRHVLAFTNNQLQNFNSSTTMSGYTNSSSLAKDMLNLAEEFKSPSNPLGNLSDMYEGMGYYTFLLDYDSLTNKFFSFQDIKRSVKQTRSIVTSGRVNDLNFSYAYSYKDKFYFGASIGVPQVNYVSTTTHSEFDDKDSMRVAIYPGATEDSVVTTYLEDVPFVRRSLLGFNSLEYTEYFKTTGSGINLKVGGIARLSPMLRVGLYLHTPTLYRLKDVYYNSLSVSFDKDPSNPWTDKQPQDGGTYNYNVITPAKLSANFAFVYKKLAVVGVDYEFTNYSRAQLTSTNVADFAGVNAVIKTKYSNGHNLRVGAELNANPVMIRLGYFMQGSPFGDMFTGDFVRNTFSLGAGFRTKNNFYLDFALSKTLSNENYFLFTTMDTEAKLKNNSTALTITAGIKF